VGDVLRYPEPRADDRAGDRRPVEDVADADIGDANAMLISDLLQNGEQLLEQCPPTPGVDHVFVFLQRGRIELASRRLRMAEVSLGEHPAGGGAVGEERQRVSAE